MMEAKSLSAQTHFTDSNLLCTKHLEKSLQGVLAGQFSWKADEFVILISFPDLC